MATLSINQQRQRMNIIFSMFKVYSDNVTEITKIYR